MNLSSRKITGSYTPAYRYLPELYDSAATPRTRSSLGEREKKGRKEERSYLRMFAHKRHYRSGRERRDVDGETDASFYISYISALVSTLANFSTDSESAFPHICINKSRIRDFQAFPVEEVARDF